MVTGTPCSGRSGAPDIISLSARRAAAIAESAVGVQTALRRGFNASSRASTASITSTGETLRSANIRASSVAGVKQSSSFVLAMLVHPPSVACTVSARPARMLVPGWRATRPRPGPGAAIFKALASRARLARRRPRPCPAVAEVRSIRR